jgi:hypothetical protein
MLDYLCPRPLPNETVFSWLCRYHLLAGHSSFRKFTLPLVGVNASRPANEFPSYLPKLSELSGIAIDSIIYDMTSAHYYQPFISSATYEELFLSLRSGNTSSLQSRLGLVANRMMQGGYLKYCPKCVFYDREHFGIAYWHREHQLVGISACTIHGCHLVEMRKLSKNILFPDSSGTVEYCGVEEYELNKLISDELFDASSQITKEIVYKLYHQQLKNLGFKTSTGRVRQQNLKQFLLNKLANLRHLSPHYDVLIEQINKEQYPECLFYRADCTHQPLKHFFLIYALFGSWSAFINEIDNVGLKQATHAYHSKAVDNKKSFWLTAIQMLKNGESLRKVAEKIGTTVSTLKIKAVQNRVAVNRRPSKIKPDVERAIWRNLLMGKKTQYIALEFNLSVGAIEKVLTQYKGLKQHRKHIWYVDVFNKHQICINEFLNTNPDATRNQIRKEVRASYYWLYKHEKEWLYRQLPKRVIARYWPRKANK